ncbi:MAG: hypothetical protein ACRDYF_19965 [Acidimicrobiia bacterium]
MRPTPSELASGLRRTLRDVVGPAVVDEYAAVQLQQVVSVLGRFDWDGAAFDVIHANRQLAELLAAGLDWLDADPERRTRFLGTAERVRLLATAPSAEAALLPASFADANDRHRQASAALEELIAALATWLADHPGDEASAGLRRRIWLHLAGEEERLVEPL